MTIRAKMVCQDVTRDSYGERVRYTCQYDPNEEKDRSFSKATPSGQAEFYVSNEALLGKMVPGKSYFFDITEAE